MTTDELDRRIRQLAHEQADTAPPAHDWDEVRARAAHGARPTADPTGRRAWAPVAAVAVLVVAAAAVVGVVLTDRSGSVSTGEQPAPPLGTDPVTSSPVPGTSPPGTAPPDTGTSPVTAPTSPAGVVSIPYRLVVPSTPTGEVWTTSLATTYAELSALWAELGVEFEPPGPEVDVATEVVIRFGLAESSSCRFGPITDLRFNPATSRLFPLVPLQDPTVNACTSDANPHTIVVVVERAALPVEAFEIWVADADPPACCPSGVTKVTAGQLLQPTPTTPDGRPVIEEFDTPIPSGAVEVGPQDLIIVHADGDLWLHPDILSDDTPGTPVRLADLADPRAPVVEGPGPNVVEEVAGVHDGAVLYSDCCEPAAGNLLAAVGPESERIVWGQSAVPAMSPDGTRLATVNFAGIQIVDLERQRSRFRQADVTQWFFSASDVIWSADGRAIWMLAFDVDGAFWVQRFDAESLESSPPVGIGLTIETWGTENVAFAGRTDAGEVAVGVTGGAAPHLRFLDPTTGIEQQPLRRELPPGTTWVRLAGDGRSLVWVTADELWFQAPGTAPRRLGQGFTAAWFTD